MGKKHIKAPPTNADPWKVLGLESEAGDEEIRQAYLARVRESPPEREPEKFEEIREAYEAIRDPATRWNLRMDGLVPELSFQSLLREKQSEVRFVGHEPWLRVVRGK